MNRIRKIIFPFTIALLVVVFTYAAMSKLLGYAVFQRQLVSSPLLRPLSGVLVWVVPAVELFAVVLLLIPVWRRYGLCLCALLLVVFTLYIIVLLLFFSDKLPCSCGGVLEQLTWGEHLVMNVVMLFLAVMCLLWRKRF